MNPRFCVIHYNTCNISLILSNINFARSFHLLFVIVAKAMGDARGQHATPVMSTRINSAGCWMSTMLTIHSWNVWTNWDLMWLMGFLRVV